MTSCYEPTEVQVQDLSSRSLDCFYKIWCSRSRTGCQSLLLTSFWLSLWLLLVQMPQGCFRVTLHARVTATEDTEVQEWEELYGNICLEVEHLIKGIKESVGYREFEKINREFQDCGKGRRGGSREKKRERVKTKNLWCPVFQSRVTEWIDTSLLLYTY